MSPASLWTDAIALVASLVAGAVAAVTGFGIGSLLTPLLALQMDTRLAVAAVSLPHLIGTSVRFVGLRGTLDRRVFWTFGLTSAAGGLLGALLQGALSQWWLGLVLGGLLLFAAIGQASGWLAGLRFRGWHAWTAGALSGLLGGLVGNQGGIRSAALLGFGLSKEQLVGTATAIALMVDGARVPVYLATQGRELTSIWPTIGIATAGVVAGTLLGTRILRRVPERWFYRTLALLLAILGAMMIIRALG